MKSLEMRCENDVFEISYQPRKFGTLLDCLKVRRWIEAKPLSRARLVEHFRAIQGARCGSVATLPFAKARRSCTYSHRDPHVEEASLEGCHFSGYCAFADDTQFRVIRMEEGYEFDQLTTRNHAQSFETFSQKRSFFSHEMKTCMFPVYYGA